MNVMNVSAVKPDIIHVLHMCDIDDATKQNEKFTEK